MTGSAGVRLILAPALWAARWARRLARRGGPQRLGTSQVDALLRVRFSFLRHEGLQKATFLAAYYATHEVYDVSPEG